MKFSIPLVLFCTLASLLAPRSARGGTDIPKPYMAIYFGHAWKLEQPGVASWKLEFQKYRDSSAGTVRVQRLGGGGTVQGTWRQPTWGEIDLDVPLEKNLAHASLWFYSGSPDCAGLSWTDTSSGASGNGIRLEPIQSVENLVDPNAPSPSAPNAPAPYFGTGAVTVAAPPVASIPAAPPTPPAPSVPAVSQTRIDELIEHKRVLADDLFGPLDRDVAPSIRDYLADLRENLLDEGARHPVATPQAYDMASQFCNGLISAFDEREIMATRLRNDAPSNAAGEPTIQRLQPNWIDYLRERDQAAAITHNNTLQTPFARANILQWSNRALQLRQSLDAYYVQFRAAARQPVPPKK